MKVDQSMIKQNQIKSNSFLYIFNCYFLAHHSAFINIMIFSHYQCMAFSLNYKPDNFRSYYKPNHFIEIIKFSFYINSVVYSLCIIMTVSKKLID